MDSRLLDCLGKAGVRTNIVEILQDEELDSADILNSASDELLRACNIKGGQIVRIRNALAALIDNEYIPERTSFETKEMTILASIPIVSTAPVNAEKPSSSRSALNTPAKIKPPSPSTCMVTFSPVPSEQDSTPDLKTSPTHIQPLNSTTEFAIEEKVNDNINWLKDFTLPDTYSPKVNESLKTGQLPGTLRDKFTREICISMKRYSLYPTKEEKESVACMIVDKYPFLSDSVGAGPNSWTKAISNRFKNMRRKKVYGSVKKSVKEKPVFSPRAPKKRKLVDLPPLADGETDETCEGHKKVMRLEMTKTNKNQTLIKELMELTYPNRRQKLSEQKGIGDTLAEFPALKLACEVEAEFGRILLDTNIVRKMVESYKAMQTKILQVTSKSRSKNMKSLLTHMEGMLSKDCLNKTDVESTISALALQFYLKEKAASNNLFFMICPKEDSTEEAIKTTTYPRLIGYGDLLDLSSLMIAAEGQIFLNLSDTEVPMAIALLVGTFYVLNIEYTPGVANVYAFLETALLKSCDHAKKRVSVQKFLKELDALDA